MPAIIRFCFFSTALPRGSEWLELVDSALITSVTLLTGVMVMKLADVLQIATPGVSTLVVALANILWFARRGYVHGPLAMIALGTILVYSAFLSWSAESLIYGPLGFWCIVRFHSAWPDSTLVGTSG